MLCSQLTEAVEYLHAEANILHNDIKGNNVLKQVSVGFGKATKVVNAKRYKLTMFEKRTTFRSILTLLLKL